MHNSHATHSFNSNKTRKTRTNKGYNKANIKLTERHQFSNTLARKGKGKKHINISHIFYKGGWL